MPLTLVSLLLLAQPAPVGEREADRTRIQRHLAAVEADLRAVDPSHLPPALQQARRSNLDRLHAYLIVRGRSEPHQRRSSLVGAATRVLG